MLFAAEKRDAILRHHRRGRAIDGAFGIRNAESRGRYHGAWYELRLDAGCVD